MISFQLKKYETNPEWKGWVFCVDKRGVKGWVSETNLLIDGNVGKVIKAYDATEIAVKKGEIVRCHQSEFGWTWVENRDGKEGWLPSKILEEKHDF